MNYLKKTQNAYDKSNLPEIFITNGRNLNKTDFLKRHTSVEISYVLAGEGSLNTEIKSFSAAAGDVFIFSPNEYHAFEFKNNDYKILTLHAEPRCVWNIGPEFPDSELLGIFFDRDKNFSNKIDFSSETAQKISGILQDVLAETQTKEKEYIISIKIGLVNILITLLRHFGHISKSAHQSSRSYNLDSLEETANFIEQNFSEPLDLDKLSMTAHLSRSHLCTVFKRYALMSPWDYITIRRIEHSLKLLEKPNLTKQEIALGCGFNNTANFYRAFSKVVGMTPTELELKQ